MDPFTAILNAYTVSVQAWMKFFDGASPEQKVQAVQNWLDFEKFWRELFNTKGKTS